MIFLVDSEKILSHNSLKWYSAHLPGADFCHVSKSIIVNCNYVESFSCDSILLKDKTRIMLSRYYKNNFENHLLNLSEHKSA